MTDQPMPRWDGGVPWCEDRCPHHDGKRCELTGFRPGNICEPAVIQLSRATESFGPPIMHFPEDRGPAHNGCSVCAEERDTPHSWRECTEELKTQHESILTAFTDGSVEEKLRERISALERALRLARRCVSDCNDPIAAVGVRSAVDAALALEPVNG